MFSPKTTKPQASALPGPANKAASEASRVDVAQRTLESALDHDIRGGSNDPLGWDFSRVRVQPKLTIGGAGDQYEREADGIAARVVGLPDRASPSSPPRYTPLNGGLPPNSFMPAEDFPTRLQTGGGHPMPDEMREFLEPRMGLALDDVRLHTDTEAATLNRSLHARAFTHGPDIYFGANQYAPGSSEGKQLIAHELAHAAQQGAISSASGPQSAPVASSVQSAPQLVQCAFEDEPVSASGHADTLVTRIQGVLREWKSECQEGVNDFVTAELAAQIDSLGSGSWPTFFISLLGNTIWAAAAFVPQAWGARAVFAVSMAGIAVAAEPTVPAASSEGKNLTLISEKLKDYYGDVFTQLWNQVSPKAMAYVRDHGQANGNQALIQFLQDTFKADQVDIKGTPNINGNAVRKATHAYASDLLNRFRKQVMPIGTVLKSVAVTDPIDRTITTKAGVVWAQRDDGTKYLTQISVENSDGMDRPRASVISFLMFIDDTLKDAALDRARRVQPRGVQTLPWSVIDGIPSRVPPAAARQ